MGFKYKNRTLIHLSISVYFCLENCQLGLVSLLTSEDLLFFTNFGYITLTNLILNHICEGCSMVLGFYNLQLFMKFDYK